MARAQAEVILSGFQGHPTGGWKVSRRLGVNCKPPGEEDPGYFVLGYASASSVGCALLNRMR